MIPLDVAVVVAWRRIGGIEVDHIVASRVEVEHVTTNRPTRLAAVEHDSVVRLGRLDEVLTQREPQVSPAVVVTQVGKREHPAGLLAGGGQHQCRDRQGSFVALMTSICDQAASRKARSSAVRWSPSNLR